MSSIAARSKNICSFDEAEKSGLENWITCSGVVFFEASILLRFGFVLLPLRLPLPIPEGAASGGISSPWFFVTFFLRRSRDLSRKTRIEILYRMH